MVKSYVEELVKVYACLLTDATYAFPTLKGEFKKDWIRLTRAITQRGLHALCMDLPALGKHLDRCLSNGEYISSGLPLSQRRSKGVPIPKLFGGLYLLVFDSKGSLKDDYNVEAVLFLRQLLYAAKKASLQCSDDNRRAEVRAFVVTDQSLPNPETFWTKVGPTTDEINSTYSGFRTSDTIKNVALQETEWSVFLRTLDKVSSILTSTLGVYDPDEWRFKHGPGVTSEGSQFGRNKYAFKNWSDRLEHVFPLADYGFHNYASWAANCDETEMNTHLLQRRRITDEDPHSRLIAVPKTFSKPRLIAAEPSEHLWCQQNVWHYFCERVRSSWLNDFVRFRDQTLNQDLCRKGSTDGSLITVDLSAASDRVSCHVVGQFFRGNPKLLLALQASRTRFIQQRFLGEEQELLALRKFSTMGSSVTFPVQSLLFLAIAISSVLTTRRLAVTLNNIRGLVGSLAVYGDDIIAPVDCRETLVGALENLFFKVNLGKTYWTGKFRESCGVDMLAGVNVTPVYWHAPARSTPESYASTVGTVNLFYKKWFMVTSRYLASTIERYKVPRIPMDSGFVGWISFVPVDFTAFKQRWNSGLQREEFLVPLPSARQLRTPIHDDTAVFQYLTEKPIPTQKWEGGIPQRPKSQLRLRWVPLIDLLSKG